MIWFFIAIGWLIVAMAIIVIAWLAARSAGQARCTQGGKHHNFQPRYSESSPFPNMDGMSDVFKTATISLAKDPLPLTTKTYIHDVCVWCGQTVKPEQVKK